MAPWLAYPETQSQNVFFLSQGAGPCWLREPSTKEEMFYQGTHNGAREKHRACMPRASLPRCPPPQHMEGKCHSSPALLNTPGGAAHSRPAADSKTSSHFSFILQRARVYDAGFGSHSPFVCHAGQAVGFPVHQGGGSVTSPLGLLQEGRFHVPTCWPLEDCLS